MVSQVAAVVGILTLNLSWSWDVMATTARGGSSKIRNSTNEICEAQLLEDAGAKATLAAASEFRKFFDSIKGQLFERDFFLNIAELGLLAKEHVLMLGPPGNAKSMGVDLIIDNIIDEKTGNTSIFKIQMTPETSLSETHGVIDYKKITEENIQTRKWEQGMLSAKLVFIDEFFDARANAIRNNLMALNEREHAQGRERIKGITESGFAASNKFIHEVYEKAGDEGPKAIIDRFAFVAYVPGDLQKLDSALRLIRELPVKLNRKLKFQDLDLLRAKVNKVVIPEHVARMLSLIFVRMKAQAEALEEGEKKRFLDQKRAGQHPLPPYRSTKYYSPRTLRKAAKILRALVVQDWIESGGQRPLSANTRDLDKLVNFFTLNSIDSDSLVASEENAVNPYEKVQIMTVLKEREMFRETYAEIMAEINARTSILTEIEIEKEAAKTPKLKGQLVEKMVTAMMNAVLNAKDTVELAALSENEIAEVYIVGTLEEWLKEILGKDFDETVAKKVNEIKDKREAETARQKKKRLSAWRRRLLNCASSS